MPAFGEDVDLDIGPRTSNPTQQTTWEAGLTLAVTASAISMSLWFERCASSRSISNASCSSIECRSIKMPLARSVIARRTKAPSRAAGPPVALWTPRRSGNGRAEPPTPLPERCPREGGTVNVAPRGGEDHGGASASHQTRCVTSGTLARLHGREMRERQREGSGSC